jgi:hypothetical protein
MYNSITNYECFDFTLGYVQHKTVKKIPKMTIIFITFYKLNIIFLVLLSVTTQPSSSEDTTETCDRDVCAPNVKKCTVFDPNNFGPENKTIIYGEARGRIGNQLLGNTRLVKTSF